MAIVDVANRQVLAKIVYYGPGLSGKTTNLRAIHALLPPAQRSGLVSIEDDGQRTLFFDYLPFEVGDVSGISFRFQLFTVTGQEHGHGARLAVLKGADGVVFVADARREMFAKNRASLNELVAALKSLGRDPARFPLVLQYNKCDLPGTMTPSELDGALNDGGWPSLQSSALDGRGVVDTLRLACRSVTKSL